MEQESQVEILPLLSIDRVRLLSAVYGPFQPPRLARVPLWLALYLRRKNKALLVPPAWMSADALAETLRIETSQPGFAPLPFDWIDVSDAILQHAEGDVRNADEVRAALMDIRTARQSKVRQGVEMVNPIHLEMTGISKREIQELRPFFQTAFEQLRRLRIEPSPDANSQPDPSSSYASEASLRLSKPDQSDSGYATGDRRP